MKIENEQSVARFLLRYPVFSAHRAGGGGIISIPPPIRPPLLPNVFNEVEEVEEEDESS
ncbi:MAG TPA: hypothetical protein VI636_09585 [Candidatus Angelobacter sp.]